MVPKLYTFEGEMMTRAEICARVPRLSWNSIRRHIEAGRSTAFAILTYAHKAKSAQKCRARYQAQGKPRLIAMGAR